MKKLLHSKHKDIQNKINIITIDILLPIKKKTKYKTHIGVIKI